MFGLGKKEQEDKSDEAKAQKNKVDSPANQKAKQFIEFIMMHAQNVMFVLGQVPTPDGRQMRPNLESAKVLIDQLELIREKTEGNLNKVEKKIIDDTIQSVNMAFVETSGGTPVSMIPSHTPEIELPELDELEDEQELESPKTEEKKTTPEDDKRKFYKSYG